VVHVQRATCNVRHVSAYHARGSSKQRPTSKYKHKYKYLYLYVPYAGPPDIGGGDQTRGVARRTTEGAAAWGT